NEEQAQVVRRIFNSVLEGVGTERIAKQINEEKIPTKRKGKCTGSTIRGIVKNEKYTGDVLLQKTFTDEHFNRKVNQGELDQYLIENHHEAIITHAEFEAANQMLEYQASQKNVAAGNRKYLNRYPFSGKIECAECGDTFKRRIHTSTHKKYIAWCCSTHIKNKDECSMLFIKEEHIHQAFITMMHKLRFARKEILHPLFETVKNGFKQDTEEQLDHIELQLTECYAKNQMLKKLMDDKFLEQKLYEEKSAKMNQQINELLEDKERLLRLIRNEEEQVYELKRL